MKEKLPSPKIQEKDVDDLIGCYAFTPNENKREKLLSFLKGQKQRFVEQERQQERERRP